MIKVNIRNNASITHVTGAKIQPPVEQNMVAVYKVIASDRVPHTE